MKNIKLSAPIPWELALSNKITANKNTTVGVLAFQGDFLEHIQTLQRLGVNAKEVRLPKDLETIDALIIPGGESTTMANLLDVFTVREIVKEKIEQGLPVWGTCAGAILLAKKLKQDRPIPLGLMDITIDRNAFGRQLESFEDELKISALGQQPFHATFIRAPKIEHVGKGVEILCKLDDGTIVAAREKNMLVTSFHPELTNDTRMHEYFLSFIQK
jgi:5'-phosphate synthase pdxT subunit